MVKRSNNTYGEFVDAIDTPSAPLASKNPYRKGFNIHTVKLVHESEFYPFADHGASIGQMIDDTIQTALVNNSELRELTVSFSEEDWNALKTHSY